MKKGAISFLAVLLFIAGLLVMLQASDINPLLTSEYYKTKIYSHLYFQTGPEIKYNLLLLFVYIGIGAGICALAYSIMKKTSGSKRVTA